MLGLAAAAALLVATGGEAASRRGGAAGAPTNTAPPAITGTAQVGKTLTTKGGSWSSATPITKVSYAWWRCDAKTLKCATIGGSGGTSYTLVAADAGHVIRVAQTAANSAGSTTAASSATGVVETADGKPAATAQPTISGTAAIGQTLAASGGKWFSSTTIKKVTWAWWRCNASSDSCTTISGANDSHYRLGDADAGHSIRVAETVTNSAGSTTSASKPTAVVPALKPAATAQPHLSGSAVVGQTLTTDSGKWTSSSPLTAVTYAWWRCDSGGKCATIPNATGSTYQVASADVGYTIRAVVTAANRYGSATEASDPTAAVTPGTGTLAAAEVKLPDRLVISGVKFSPRSLRSRNTFLAEFRVTDTAGRPVSGALVYALGLPYSWVQHGRTVATGQDGWAIVPINPSRKMPLGRGHALVMFVRATVPGQKILGGASARRLVQVTIGY